MDTLAYAKLRTQLEELAHFSSTLALLQWDQEIYMPAKGGEPRAKLISYLSVVAHEKLLALNSGKLLTKLVQEAKKTPNTPEAIVIRDVWRSYTRERKLPTAFVQELAELESKAAAERAVSAVLEALTAGLKADGTVALVGFGTFDVKERKARTGVNPATGEKIKIAASKTVGFKAGKALKDEFNKAKAAKAAKKK